MEPGPVVRRLRRDELVRVAEIDRRERIDLLYEQQGTRLVERPGDWSASAWDPVGHGEHSVEAQLVALRHEVDHGGIALGVLADGGRPRADRSGSGLVGDGRDGSRPTDHGPVEHGRDGDRLVGLGVVVPHIRPGIAQLAYLHVSAPFRATGIGTRLCWELEQLGRDLGDTELVVSATPSANTVRFYLGRGFRPMAEPLPELLEREPEDVHLHKVL